MISVNLLLTKVITYQFLIAKEYDDFYSEVREHLGKRSAYIFVTIFYWIFRNKEFKKLRNKWKN